MLLTTISKAGTKNGTRTPAHAPALAIKFVTHHVPPAEGLLLRAHFAEQLVHS